MKVIDSIDVSPGLFVNMYLKKFININNWIKKIVKNIGICPLILFLMISIRDRASEKK